MKRTGKMEIHFPHITNGIHNTKRRTRLVTPRRLLGAAMTVVLCSSVAAILAACNVGGGGY